MILTQQILVEISDKISKIVDEDSERFGKVDLWWNKVASERKLTSRSEKLAWLKATGGIEYSSDPSGGQSHLERLDQLWHELTPKFAESALLLNQADFSDTDGQGFDASLEWWRARLAEARHWPQWAVSEVMRANPVTYDGQLLFSASHPVNGQNTANGVFSNSFTGVTMLATVDQGAANAVKIATACANIRKLRGPNGKPRGLRASRIFVPPALEMAASIALEATFVGGTVGSTEMTASQRRLNLEIVVCDELGAEYSGGSDAVYYLGVDSVIGGQMGIGGVIYGEREAFTIEAQPKSWSLESIDAFAWKAKGRNVAAPGHPFLIFKCA